MAGGGRLGGMGFLPRRPACMVCGIVTPTERYHKQAADLRSSDTAAEHKRLVIALMREDVTTASERQARLTTYS